MEKKEGTKKEGKEGKVQAAAKLHHDTKRQENHLLLSACNQRATNLSGCKTASEGKLTPLVPQERGETLSECTETKVTFKAYSKLA